jgi:deoxyxylulose-5-phosphate synthase
VVLQTFGCNLGNRSTGECRRTWQAYVQPHPKWTYNSRLHQSATDAADNLFKAIGFDYFGPFDGHDVEQLTQVFHALKNVKALV